MEKDPQLGRFWQHHSMDGVKRERQLIVDFLVAATGGPLYYKGRDMKLSHQGTHISEGDWTIFLKHDWCRGCRASPAGPVSGFAASPEAEN